MSLQRLTRGQSVGGMPIIWAMTMMGKGIA